MLILVPGSVVCVCLHVVLHSVFRSQQPDATEAGTAKVDVVRNTIWVDLEGQEWKSSARHVDEILPHFFLSLLRARER